MSSIPQNHSDEKALVSCVQRFFSKHHVGKLLARCKKTELGSKVFDHTDMRFKKGFRMLTLSWSDGNTLIPVNSCLLASAKDTNIIGPVRFQQRSFV